MATTRSLPVVFYPVDSCEALVEMVVSLAGVGTSDDLRALRTELVSDDLWRGRVALVERSPKPGTLGPILEGLRVLAEPGAVVAFFAAIATFIRYRGSDVDLQVTRTEKTTTVTMSARRVRGLDASALKQEIEHLARQLDAGSHAPEDSESRCCGTDT